jgi:RNA-binding protein
MKFAHSIMVTVFAQEDYEATRKTLLTLFPFNLEEEKIPINVQNSVGFEEKIIRVLTVKILKERHTDAFLKNLLAHLTTETKQLILRQAESRLDEELDFFLRFDKDRLMAGEYWVTEGGNCYHLKMAVAAFPHKREVALEVVRTLFS